MEYQEEVDASTLGSRSYDDNVEDEVQDDVPRILTAAAELDSLCRGEFAHISGTASSPACSAGFPSRLLPIVLLFSGNHCCVDCGNEETEALQYGSVGYGTLLCEICANRHVMYTGEESNIQPLSTANWPLRSILAIIAGSNSQMLEYIRSKPRWRPPKSNATEPEEVLAFKQIYLSKAASTYRDMITQWVDQTYREKLTQIQYEIATKDRLYQMQHVPPMDPFESIFARSHVSREDILGFASGNKINRNSGLGDSFSTAKGGNVSGNANHRSTMAPSFMPPEALPIDTIKAKIYARRNRNPSIRAQNQQAEAMAQDMMRGMNLEDDGTEYQEQQQYRPVLDYRSFRRRSIDIVGEVEATEFSMQDQEYDDTEQLKWGSYGDDVFSMSMAEYTNHLPRYRNNDVKSVGVSVASARGRGYDDQTLGSMPLDNAGVRLATYRRRSSDGK